IRKRRGLAASALAARMEGIARESLHWVRGSLMAQVATYSRAPMGPERSDYLTVLAVNVEGQFEATAIEDALAAFNEDFESYIRTQGSTIGGEVQLQRQPEHVQRQPGAEPRRGRPIDSQKYSMHSSPVRPLPLDFDDKKIGKKDPFLDAVEK